MVRTLRAAFGDWRKAWLLLSQLPPGEIRIDGDMYPTGSGPTRRSRSQVRVGQEVLRTAASLGRSVPRRDDPDVDTTGPELVNAISDDKLRQSA